MTEYSIQVPLITSAVNPELVLAKNVLDYEEMTEYFIQVPLITSAGNRELVRVKTVLVPNLRIRRGARGFAHSVHILAGFGPCGLFQKVKIIWLPGRLKNRQNHIVLKS